MHVLPCMGSLNFIYFTTITKQVIFGNQTPLYSEPFGNQTPLHSEPFGNQDRWHRCLRSGGLPVGGNQSTRRKPICLTWWPHDHFTWPSHMTISHADATLPLRQPDRWVVQRQIRKGDWLNSIIIYSLSLLIGSCNLEFEAEVIQHELFSVIQWKTEISS